MFEKVKIKQAPIGAIDELPDESVGYVEFPFDVIVDPNSPPLGLDPDTVVTLLITPTELASKWINSYNYEISKPISPARPCTGLPFVLGPKDQGYRSVRFRDLVIASLILLVFSLCTGLAAILLIAVR